MNTIAERAELAMRLENGWQLIVEAERAGKDVSAWEQHWLTLLALYERHCRDASDIAQEKEGVMPVEIRCHTCGAPRTLSKADLVRGQQVYRQCRACRENQPASTCQGCGRPLLATGRQLCASCLGAMTA
jgi:hypothetical protein